jgi:RNA polymerase sigma factor (TIGR02999 family)
MVDSTYPADEITLLLASWRGGNEKAFQKLFTLLYDDLRSIARSLRRRSSANGTLSTTAVVHEAFLKLVEASPAAAAERRHFLAIAAKVMRHILIDAARRRAASKRDPEGGRVPLDEFQLPVGSSDPDLLSVHEALTRLESIDARLASIVEMRFFGGYSVEETAGALDVTDRTVRREWRKARAFLQTQLSPGGAA